MFASPWSRGRITATFHVARRNDDLAFVLERALVTGDAGDDVDLLVLEAREVAEIVFQVAQGPWFMVRGLRDDVGEEEGEGVVEAARGAIEGARQVAAVDAVAVECAGAGVVVGRELRGTSMAAQDRW